MRRFAIQSPVFPDLRCTSTAGLFNTNVTDIKHIQPLHVVRVPGAEEERRQARVPRPLVVAIALLLVVTVAGFFVRQHRLKAIHHTRDSGARAIASSPEYNTPTLLPAADVEDRRDSSPAGVVYYVSPKGKDSNNGSRKHPFATISKAATVATPGATVIVLPGRYRENVVIDTSGTPSKRIVIKSENKWAAKITGPEPGYVGVFRVNANYVDISGFDIFGNNTAPYGSSVGVWIAGSYNRVNDNLIHDLTSQSIEAVGILVNFRKDTTGGDYHDNDVFDNVIHHMYMMDHTIHGPGPAAGTGIYICDGPNRAWNNLVYSVGKQGLKTNHNATHVVFTNNTAADAQWDGFMMAVGGDELAPVNDYSVFSNNISIDNRRDGISFWEGAPGKLGPHNKVVNNLTWNNGRANVLRPPRGIVDEGSIHSDPKFVNRSYSGDGDFRLLPGSPAIDKGAVEYAPRTDLDGAPRPDARSSDLGAYEHRPGR
jgi:hypothetical protein